MALGEPLLAPDLPGHGHSDSPAPGVGTAPEANAADLAVVIREHAPEAELVVGMSLGGLTAISLAAADVDLVANLMLVDITPGVTGEKAKAIHDFVRGPGHLPELRRAARTDDAVQPDPLRVVAPARHPPQRHPARRRQLGVASPPRRLLRDGRHRPARTAPRHHRPVGRSRRIPRSRHPRTRNARAVRGRGTTTSPNSVAAAPTPGWSSSMPATASRATNPSTSPTSSATPSPDQSHGVSTEILRGCFC